MAPVSKKFLDRKGAARFASDKLSADDPRLLLFSKGFWLQSDRSATDARRAGDRKLTRLVLAYAR